MVLEDTVDQLRRGGLFMGGEIATLGGVEIEYVTVENDLQRNLRRPCNGRIDHPGRIVLDEAAKMDIGDYEGMRHRPESVAEPERPGYPEDYLERGGVQVTEL